MARSAGRRVRALAAVLIVVAVAAIGGTAVAAPAAAAEIRRTDLRVTVTPEPDGRAVALDATLFLPERDSPAPAVLLAHGFGGSKESLVTQAEELAADGYAVLTYTARGFGSSGGAIHLDAPRFEVADASRLLDLLADRPEVQQDARGDPRVAVVGASYGGALALLLAGTDPRVDAVAAMITWHDLRQALFPQSAVAAGPQHTPAAVQPAGGPGVFKRLWAGAFFASGNGAYGNGADGAGHGTCGRFAPELCAAYARVASTGRPDAQLLGLLAASSPARVLAHVRAPTLLVQGESDSLFPLSESDANAAGIAATGTPVKSVWVAGGHDGGFDPADERVHGVVSDWLGAWLSGAASPSADLRFEAAVPRTVRTRGDRDRQPPIVVAPGLPGAGLDVAVPTTTVRVTGGTQQIVAPAGGTPAAITSVPGLSALSSALGSLATSGLDTAAVASLPGQTATFESTPLADPVRIVGAPRVRLTIRSSTRDATLFGSLQDVAADGSASLPQRLVAPLRVPTVPGRSVEVTVALPAIVRDIPAGHRLRVVVATTDSAYALPTDARTYSVALTGGRDLVLPLAVPASEGGAVLSERAGPSAGLLVAAVAVLLVLLLGVATVLARRSRGRAGGDVVEELRDVPVAVRGLGKAYGDGFRAVTHLSFRVERGQVLGLLGPNGAGKTTTLRMLLGLIRPTEGELRVFGHPVRPGAPVLSRMGSLVEGPGLLPHLSGLDNLRSYWRATGRPDGDARFDVALEIAGLEDDISRRVRTYSHGMRQRLAIAQAMLGLPELLVLDEPTNGLDPPQIREMREVLRQYAATGRTVVLSSHLLAEVEQTCTHVVVMHHGRLVAHGEVAALVGSATALVVDVDDPERAAKVADDLEGVEDLRTTPTGVVLRLVGTPRGDLVRALVEAGLSVERVAPQHGLEEAFLTLIGEG